jgi:1-acyl-sn-glycerol-3-phosphate acyltransferase
VNPPGKRLWRPGRVRIVVGSPLDLSDFRSDRPGDIRRATDVLMDTISKLSGQEYVDVYTRPAA